MDDKTFILSKIKGEMKDEYKVLHGLRSMIKPKKESEGPYLRMLEDFAIIIMTAAVCCILMPTFALIISGHAKQKTMWLWFIVEVSICILGVAHFTKKYMDLKLEIREDFTA